jgi:aerobic-type carbon monoxide dehydrogenase small subunit (CoxS/CutS family)
LSFKIIAMDLTINNKTVTVAVDRDDHLLSVLREKLDLTGSKPGCGEGACGACTVLVDGVAIRSCITPASAMASKKITTIEGLERNGKLHRVQQAFLDIDVFQCSYCASGMIMSAVSLLEKYPKPTEQQINGFMQGNICRCGTYPRIVKAIKLAAQ